MALKLTEYLQYHFTDEELLDLARTNARTQSEKRALENQKAQITKSLAGEIAAKDTELQRLSEFVSNGYEYRMIECTVALDDPKRGTATIYRTDTGEAVKQRRMSEDEMQMQLDLENPTNDEQSIPCSISHNGEEVWSGTTDDINNAADALKGRGL